MMKTNLETRVESEDAEKALVMEPLHAQAYQEKDSGHNSAQSIPGIREVYSTVG